MRARVSGRIVGGFLIACDGNTLLAIRQVVINQMVKLYLTTGKSLRYGQHTQGTCRPSVRAVYGAYRLGLETVQ
jgi:hypothetical protein